MARTPDQPVSTERGRRRRRELLEAARAVFEEVGYVDANVSDIVRVSGGSRASFYAYFSSIDDVLEVLVRELADDLFEAATLPIEPGPSPFDSLESTIRQFMHAYRDRRGLLGVFHQAMLTNDAFREIRLEIRSRFADSIAATFADRSDWRDGDGLDSKMTAVAIRGMVEDVATGLYLLGQDLDEEHAVHTLAVIWARTVGLPSS